MPRSQRHVIEPIATTADSAELCRLAGLRPEEIRYIDAIIQDYRARRFEELTVRASGPPPRTLAGEIRAGTLKVRRLYSDATRDRMIAAFHQAHPCSKSRRADTERNERELMRQQGELDRIVCFMDQFAPQLPKGKVGRPHEDTLELMLYCLNCLLAHLTGARITTAQPDKTTGYCTKEFAVKFFEIGDRVFDTKLSILTITNAIKQLNELTKAERRRHTFENLLRHVNTEILYLQEELTHLDEARSIKTWLEQRLVAMPLTKSKKQRYKLENVLRLVDAQFA